MRNMTKLRIDFFVVGVQKGGTTALDRMLRDHPGIQMARRKEVHFFDDEDIDWMSPDFTGLHQEFDWSKSGAIRGEVTPIYIYWRSALARIRNYNPDARIIVALRHPSFRAYSHWRMEFGRNAETLPFIDAVSSGRARVSDAPGGQHRVHSYVERGFYEHQIVELKRHFPAHQIHFFRTDSLWTDPRRVLQRIEVFLGVEPYLAPHPAYIVPMPSAQTPPMSNFDRSYLDKLFEPTIAALSDLTGLQLDDWRRPDYSEPMDQAIGIRR